MRFFPHVPAFICTALFASMPSSAFEASSPNNVSVGQIIEYYTYLAFGSEWPTNSSRDTARIFKRAENERVLVLPLVKPSVPIGWAIAEVEGVVDSLNKKNAGPPIVALDEDEIVNFLKTNLPKDRNDPSSDWPHTIIVYIGSEKELEGPVNAVAAQLPSIRQAFEMAKDSQDVPFCAVASQQDPNMPDFIGTSIAWIQLGPNSEACLYEEIMQSFGLGRDFPAGVPSIFSDDELYQIPSDLDWQIWRIHTDPRIMAGMTKEEVFEIIPNIIEADK